MFTPRAAAIDALHQRIGGEDCSGWSWPCENAGALRTRRTIFLSSAMFARPVVRRLGTRSAARTRFPSVDVVSGFSHGQGHLETWRDPRSRGDFWSPAPPITDVPAAARQNGECVPTRDSCMQQNPWTEPGPCMAARQNTPWPRRGDL